MDYSPPGSSVRGILQARILEWALISFCRGSFQVRYPSQPASFMSPALESEFVTTRATWKAHIYIQYLYMYICTFMYITIIIIICNYIIFMYNTYMYFICIYVLSCTICVCIYVLFRLFSFSLMNYYKTLNIVPHATQ